MSLMPPTRGRGDRNLAAKEWRYAVLSSVVSTHVFQADFTGHTRTYLAETVLFNLAHGAGSDGLLAMTWERSLCEGVRLVHPVPVTYPARRRGDFCVE